MNKKTFFFRLGIIGILISIVVYLFTKKTADGLCDSYYMRFTSSKQNSLIVGTSRSAQDLQPEAINTILKNSKYESTVYNFSFTLDDSPFGPGYYNAIKKKLNGNSHRGLFIVTVDPWAVSTDTSNKNDDPDIFFEKRSFVTKMNFVNMSPNFEYIFRFYGKPLIALAYKKKKSVRLHDDGWLEVSPPMDSMSVLARIKEKTDKYTSVANSSKFSLTRYFYLEKIIELLQQHGDVFLVRLPVGKEMSLIEKKMMPDFDKKVEEASIKYNIQYINFINESGNFLTIDGNHLYKSEGYKISQKIALLISGKNG